MAHIQVVRLTFSIVGLRDMFVIKRLIHCIEIYNLYKPFWLCFCVLKYFISWINDNLSRNLYGYVKRLVKIWDVGGEITFP